MRSNLALFSILLFSCAHAQYQYGLKPAQLNEYLEQTAKNPDNELVDLEVAIPGIQLDIRYATTNNFTGEVIYRLAKAYARKPGAEALARVQSDLKKDGYELKIFDGYRPYAATVKFYEVYGDTTFVASPYRGSRHNRGCALDLTMIDSKTGRELKMPTGYDSFEAAASPTYPIKNKLARKNRDYLIAAMERHGFKVYASEWWHFDFVGWDKFDVMDIQFEELAKIDSIK